MLGRGRRDGIREINTGTAQSIPICSFVLTAYLFQVPQYCLEDAAQRGAPCNIIVAQPRRISAMSVAERVAAERGHNFNVPLSNNSKISFFATNSIPNYVY